MNYYNENDPKAAAWLRELIKQGSIPAGEVDQRSISDVKPNELFRFTQCHFFAGIGGWPYALQLAGWPEDKPVWTGSCPCQPFSIAGEGKGIADERHLWPVFFELIRACNPPTVLGEQVASKAGREWLDGVFTDLEGMEYDVAGADLCAACVGSPHIRQRLYWVANMRGQGSQERQVRKRIDECETIKRSGPFSGMEDAGSQPERRKLFGPGKGTCETKERTSNQPGGPGGINAWSDCEIIHCRDGKARRTQSGLFPLAHGIPGRVGLLRGYGNAIVPQVAAEFIKASLEAIAE